jgi:hypothetical protein
LKEFKDGFCMNIQKIEKDSTKVGTTQNWTKNYYTTDTSSQVLIKFKLCYNSQTKYW